MKRIIAIDGTSGSGKSTVAKIIATKLGYLHFNSGNLYRAMAYSCLQNNINLEKLDDISNYLKTIKITLKIKKRDSILFINNVNVTNFLRLEKVGIASSTVAKTPIARKMALKIQQSIARKYNVVMDGRDIGTEVFPHAFKKFYVTASVEVRAKRRFDQIKDIDHTADYYQIYKDIEMRDNFDMNRKISPLIPAKDAVIVDSSNMDIKQTVDYMIKVIKSPNPR